MDRWIKGEAKSNEKLNVDYDLVVTVVYICVCKCGLNESGQYRKI